MERIQDMLEAVQRIEKYASQGRRAFDSDELIQVYILHYLQILGEAAYKVPADFRKKYPEVPWNMIQGTRHILVHDYFQVDLEVVWRVVEKDLPDLKRKLQDIKAPGAQEPTAVYKARGPKLKRGKKK
ncbi:MAG TPA: HepT-like ribonuclease domain-containing protein [bacterium]|nr:HepT-like ribonuclease domain-containing protein [bacterium]